MLNKFKLTCPLNTSMRKKVVKHTARCASYPAQKTFQVFLRSWIWSVPSGGAVRQTTCHFCKMSKPSFCGSLLVSPQGLCDLPLHEAVTSLVGNRRHVCCVFFVVLLLCLCDFQVFFVRSLRMIAGTKDAHLKMPLRIWLMRRFAYRIVGSVLFEAPLQTLVEFRASREAYEGHRVPLWIRAFFTFDGASWKTDRGDSCQLRCCGWTKWWRRAERRAEKQTAEKRAERMRSCGKRRFSTLQFYVQEDP